MEIADLILVRGTGLISQAIEEGEHSPYSHVAGVVGPGKLIEANGFRRIGYVSLSRYTGCFAGFTCDALTDAERQAIVAYVTREVGGHYDYVLLGLELLRYVFHWAVPYTEGKDVRICSTLWSDAYRRVGMELCPGIRYPSPGDLAKSKQLRRFL